METPLRSDNYNEIIKSNYKRKFLLLPLSPLNQNNLNIRNKSLKSKNDSNISHSPQMSFFKNSFFFSQKKNFEKRNTTAGSLPNIQLFNQYDNRENIIYNKKFIQKNSYNILVAVRVRPLNKKEELISTDETITVENKNMILLKDPNGYMNPNNIRTKEQFLTFDYAFDKNETQENIFNNTTKFLIKDVLNGYNATVFAYGATGAGKTYTMLGNDENPGIMPYTLKELFEEIKLYPEREYKIKLWYLEIYNENIRDLLTNNSENLELREDPIRGLIVNGIIEKETNSTEDILSLLKKGNKNRTTEETDANEASSRSHAILQILVSYTEKEKIINNINIINANNINANINNNDTKLGKLSLIDLAGSERASISGSKGMRLIEGGNINRSLLVLGNCINALCESNLKGNKYHIPYRDSKLTRLLKDSLGGNSRTVMIANVSPFIYNFDDTYNTLKYAERAKHVKNKINKNIINYNTQYLRNNYLNVIRKLHGKINDLENRLLFYEANDKFFKNSETNVFFKYSNIKDKNDKDSINNNNLDEINKKFNLSGEKNGINYDNNNKNERDNNKNIIKEDDIELETSNISIIQDNEKIINLIDDYIQQVQAEVKIKQKIMGIHYDIYLLNNIIKEKESKKQNISEEKTKLKSYKKILEKNISCFKEISQKNENILSKYIDNKTIESECERKNSNILIENYTDIKEDKIELNELQKRLMHMIRKICKIQMENIEIKYNYALIKDEITNKDKKIKNLEKQIEFRDMVIKEKIALDNLNITDEEINKKHNLLLSEQKKIKFKTCTRIKNNEKLNQMEKKINQNNKEKTDKNLNLNIDVENTINVNVKKVQNRRKHFSFHPRNSSFIKSNEIKTPNRDYKLADSLMTHTFLNNRGYEKDTNITKYNSSDINIDNKDYENNLRFTVDNLSKDENNEIIGNEFNEIIKNFNINSITNENFGDKITIKKRESDALINNLQNNNIIIKNENIKKENHKDKNSDKDNLDDDLGDDTNNKTLKSVLNDIKIMNSDINSKLTIIENSSKNKSNSQIKPISRTMANTENINNFVNNENKKEIKKIIDKKSEKKINNINAKTKRSSQNTSKKIKNIKNNIKTSCNSSSNLNLITGNMNHSKDLEYNNIFKQINKDLNNENNNNPNFMISVNRNKKNRHKNLTLVPSMSSNVQLNTINANKDHKSNQIKSPLYKTNSINIKGNAYSSSKTINYHKMLKNNSAKRNNSLLTNNIDIDELRKNIREKIANKRNKYNIKKKYIKETHNISNNNNNTDTLNKNENENTNEVNNNINIDKIINSTIQNKEKTKLQLFYSEHLNKQKSNKKGSPKNLTHKKISNAENISKNSKSTINNNDSSIVDMGTNHETIDNRKKKSFICPNKNKNKKEGNKYPIKNLAISEKKGK